jgi:hypothetical protein
MRELPPQQTLFEAANPEREGTTVLRILDFSFLKA